MPSPSAVRFNEPRKGFVDIQESHIKCCTVFHRGESTFKQDFSDIYFLKAVRSFLDLSMDPNIGGIKGDTPKHKKKSESILPTLS